MGLENKKIDLKIDRIISKYRIPGIAAGIFKEGKIVYVKGYGVADLELGTPVNPAMPFRIGSISKTFIAAAVLQLVEKGRLSLDDRLVEFFKEAPVEWKGITIEDLLAHKAGIADYLDKKYTGFRGIFDLRLDFPESELITDSYRLPTVFKPGRKYYYSNTNYMLLGFIISKITGKTYYRILEENIFRPLKMQSAAIHLHDEIVFNRPKGYELVSGKIKNAGFISDTFNNTADGSLYCNIFDMAKWDSALYGSNILSKNSLESMFSVKAHIKGSKYGYGLGWFIREGETGKIVEHTGSWGGFTSVITRDLSSKITVTIFTNIYRGGSGWLLDRAHDVLSIAKTQL